MNTVYRKDAKNAKFTSFLFSFERKENKSYNALWQLYNSIRQYICALNDYAMIFCVSIFFSALSAEKIYLFFANFAS
jgi:hypothetical protein